MSKARKQQVVVAVKMPREIVDRLELAARSELSNTSTVVRRAVLAELARREQQVGPACAWPPAAATQVAA